MLTLIQDEFERFMAANDDRPIVMLNLLRFRPEDGKAQYLHYMDVAGPLLARHDAEIVYFGEGMPALSAETGQAWDAVLLVRYASRHSFVALAQDPEYCDQAAPLRAASLVEAVLQPLRNFAG